MTKPEVIYLAVTPDELETVIACTDTLKEMAVKFNMTVNTISSAISKNRNGKIRGVKFLRVIVDDENE